MLTSEKKSRILKSLLNFIDILHNTSPLTPLRITLYLQLKILFFNVLPELFAMNWCQAFSPKNLILAVASSKDQGLLTIFFFPPFGQVWWTLTRRKGEEKDPSTDAGYQGHFPPKIAMNQGSQVWSFQW